MRSLMLGCAAAASLIAVSATPAAAQACELDRPVVFGDLNWPSAQVLTESLAIITEEGFGCDVERLPGGTIPILTGLAAGDVDVVSEVWVDGVTEPWEQGIADGLVRPGGVTYQAAQQGWYVPRYVVEGDDAPAPNLVSVTDLADHAELFEDPEEPGLGRFYNCELGWFCEEINTRKLHAYGLSELYNNYRPGSQDALNAAILRAVDAEEPILFYYFTPSWVFGAFDLVRLEEPTFDQETWDALNAADDADDVDAATAYPDVQVIIGLNVEFADAAPELAAFLDGYSMQTELMNELLAELQSTGAETREIAELFLREHEDVWTAWVSDEVAARVRDSL